ncbi:MAG TPA: hypothetical protein VL359_00325, partial [bacterium]|nr:hypothetical protein [bacterium]
MPRRILSADAALVPHQQVSLTMPVPEARSPLLQELQARWQKGPPAPLEWRDRGGLLAEIDLVNRAQQVLDEAAIKIAPVLLRIVLAVKEHLPLPAAQRAFLAEHLHLDFRRLSELCIVAESYALLDAQRREEGAREIERYGWSIALKLAYVRDPHDRADLWRRASAGRPKAAYRDVLEQIHLYRQRKLIGATPGEPSEADLRQAVTEAHLRMGELAQQTYTLRAPA